MIWTEANCLYMPHLEEHVVVIIMKMLITPPPTPHIKKLKSYIASVSCIFQEYVLQRYTLSWVCCKLLQLNEQLRKYSCSIPTDLMTWHGNVVAIEPSKRSTEISWPNLS